MSQNNKKNVRHPEFNLTQDLVAKKLLRNTKLTAQLITDILDIPVKEVKILDGAQIKFIPEDDITSYSTSVDVLAELDDGTQAIIEIQVSRQDSFTKRLWTYMCVQASQNADEIKRSGIATHYIYEHMIPVYAIAITERNYFEDDRAFRVIGFCDLETKEQFKVEIKDIEEKRHLMLMAYLELEKYNSDSLSDYRKLQWFEFFGNKPFTKSPGELIVNTDHELDYKTWSKEDKQMYNAAIRKHEAYHGSLLYERKEGIKEGIKQGIERGIEQGIEQGIEKGIEQGRAEGEISAFTKLVHSGAITKEIAAAGLGISVSEFEKYL